MTETQNSNDVPDVVNIRRSVTETVRTADRITRSELRAHVAAATDTDPTTVGLVIDRMEKRGDIYLVGDNDPEVRRP